ncbi:MAG TPA: acetyl-CoA carboxylase biotin carboxylase subunit [Steroidobacteraceae bacterium]
MFDSILIANRGEIACRIMRTARRLGIRTIAVYSDADVGALHVASADLAVRIGEPAARASYLNIGAIVEAARRTGAVAIHPGYGFLSENADFAAACRAAGLAFIGPPESAIRAMGSKIAAKRLMARAGVPIVPGYQEEDQATERLHAAATSIGYPVLIKASAGGGGKGMRVVESAESFVPALESARREAQAAFGDGRVLLEKYLSRPRHIEMQVFADHHGNCIHLNERDCSIQRRHQKIIEEAPAPGLTAQRRKAMGAAAVKAAKAVGYQGAGTVEFIAADGEFYFMEMNTRLQVEHPVTEMITGLDLVEWQIRVAAGEELPLSQSAVPLQGHAIEARLYAEDPQREFLPSTGRLVRLRWPTVSESVRIDTGVREGDEVGIHYDPMLAKIIAHGADRAAAIRTLRHALGGCQVGGVTTNVALLQAILAEPDFSKGDVHTGFIAAHAATLASAGLKTDESGLYAAAAVAWLARPTSVAGSAGASGPWDQRDGWQPNLPARVSLQFVAHGEVILVELSRTQGSWQALIGSHRLEVQVRWIDADVVEACVAGEPLRITLVEDGERLHVLHAGGTLALEFHDPARARARERQDGGLVSPMPGQVLQILVAPGANVRRGQALVIVEAMKMEHTILAPSDGVVEAICFNAGDRVSEGAQLLRLRTTSAS